MVHNSKDEVRARAESRFEKAQKSSQEGAKVRAQYEADARAVRDKTTRLRSLRLAKEAADKEAEIEKKAAAAPKKKRAPAKSK